MKVLYSTQGDAEFDGSHYYHNGAQTNYKRYMCLGEEMTILLSRKVVKNPTMSMIDGFVKLVFVKKINSIKKLLLYSFSNQRKIKEAVKSTDICVIHLPDGNGNTVVKYAKKYNKPYFCVVCGCAWDSLWNYDWRGKIVAPFSFLQARKSIKDAPYVIYVTTEFLQKRYPTNGRWIACSNVNINTGVYGVLKKRLEKINSYNDLANLRIGTSAAVDVSYKGQELVIKAISVLKKKGIVFEYHLIGRGDEKRLRAVAESEDASELVVFHGSLPHDQVLPFLDDIDIYIQPSKTEGLPRATIEALSRGCLCMGTDIAGLPELIDKKYLFPKGDVSRISDILQHISKEDLKEQAQINYEIAKLYDKDCLTERRQAFIYDFKRYCNIGL